MREGKPFRYGLVKDPRSFAARSRKARDAVSQPQVGHVAVGRIRNACLAGVAQELFVALQVLFNSRQAEHDDRITMQTDDIYIEKTDAVLFHAIAGTRHVVVADLVEASENAAVLDRRRDRKQRPRASAPRGSGVRSRSPRPERTDSKEQDGESCRPRDHRGQLAEGPLCLERGGRSARVAAQPLLRPAVQPRPPARLVPNLFW